MYFELIIVLIAVLIMLVVNLYDYCQLSYAFSSLTLMPLPPHHLLLQ